MGKEETTNQICCTAVGILFNVVSRTSILLVTVMSVDRFVGLFYPAFYKRNIKNGVFLVRRKTKIVKYRNVIMLSIRQDVEQQSRFFDLKLYTFWHIAPQALHVSII